MGETDLLTAMLGVKKLNDIPALALVVDEGLPFGQVVERRKAMADSLSEFIKHNAPKAHFRVPDNLLTQCLYLIELVQPLAIAEDKYAANYHEMAQAKGEGRLVEEFHHVFIHLIGRENPEQKYVYRAIALHLLVEDNSLTANLRSLPAGASWRCRVCTSLARYTPAFSLHILFSFRLMRLGLISSRR
ncbi:hypothetical protein [Kluyvera intermedia]|uniref:hypothetical protein n=1 Tax=Kluyvera intermedia TaxID=61648 RepID=UPI0035236067